MCTLYWNTMWIKSENKNNKQIKEERNFTSTAYYNLDLSKQHENNVSQYHICVNKVLVLIITNNFIRSMVCWHFIKSMLLFYHCLNVSI
jgi:hypothetical protein